MKTQYKLSNNISIETERVPTPLEDWRKEGLELFGDSARNWKFKCPMCGKIYSIQEFVDAGGDVQHSFIECIGRHKGAGSPGSKDGNPDGCDWAAWGLLGIPNDKGRLVLMPDGTVLEVFDFAREENDENN